jgi:hypothetical protein
LIESHSTRSEAAGDELDGPTLAKMFRAEARAAAAIQKNPEKYAHHLVEEAGGLLDLKDLKLSRLPGVQFLPIRLTIIELPPPRLSLFGFPFFTFPGCISPNIGPVPPAAPLVASCLPPEIFCRPPRASQREFQRDYPATCGI